MTRSAARKARQAQSALAEAARRNGLLSQGPVTPEGKARSSQNAITHGLTAKHVVVHPEEQQTYAEFVAGLQAEIKPMGAFEITYFEQLVRAAWNLRRIAALEAHFFQATGIDPLLLLTPDPILEKKIRCLYRHKASNQRDFHRAHKELKILQTSRLARLENPGIAETRPPLAAFVHATKRTQPAPLQPSTAAPPIEEQYPKTALYAETEISPLPQTV